MNYLAEIREFYNWLEQNPIGASAISLWYALMHISNKSGWQEWFTVSIATLELKTGLKRDAVYRARNTLRQNGRLEFRERAGRQCSVYHINEFVSQITTQPATQPAIQPATQPTTQTTIQTATINKPNQTKPENNIPPKSPKGDSGEGKANKKAKRNVIPPSLQDVEAYCMERNNGIDAEEFIDFYASKGWKVGKEPMRDWEACIRTWERQRKQRNPTPSQCRSVENIDTFKPTNILF